MTKPVVITADSTCDLPLEITEKYNIKIMPLGITIDGKSYRDGIDISPDDIYSFYRTKGVLPKTSAVSPAEYFSTFENYTKQGYAVVHISLSSKISSTYQNAVLAASELSDVYPVDSLNLCHGMGLLIIKACEMRDAGMDAADIAREITSMRSLVRATFVLDTLEFLYKGGRCSAVAALGANLLKLKPCIAVQNGSMDIEKKYRGKIDAVYLQYAAEKLAKRTDLDLDRVFIGHSGISDSQLNKIKKVVTSNAKFKEVIIARAGCTITSHCGPNTMAVMFMVKPDGSDK